MNTTITINMNTTAMRRLDQQVRADPNATRHPGKSATAQMSTTGNSTTHLVRQPRSATMTWAAPGLGPLHTTA